MTQEHSQDTFPIEVEMVYVRNLLVLDEMLVSVKYLAFGAPHREEAIDALEAMHAQWLAWLAA